MQRSSSPSGSTPTTGMPFEAMTHRIRLLLPVLLVVVLAFPVADLGAVATGLYVGAYVAVLALGAQVAATTRARQRGIAVLSVAVGASLISWARMPDNAGLTLLGYAVLALFHVVAILAVAEYVLEADVVTRNVLAAGTSLFILVGGFFVPLHMMGEVATRLVTDHSAFQIGQGGPVTWQLMVYFSFSTLTTLGYGDIQPATDLARSLSMVEAICGVLLVAVLVGRLVSQSPEPTQVRRRRSREERQDGQRQDERRPGAG